MATRQFDGGGAQALPLGLIAQALPRLTRHELEAVTERLIDYLDSLDSDPDVEPNGDELDGSGGEDDFKEHSNWKAEPGCPISDPDYAVDDKPCDEPFQDLECEQMAGDVPTVPCFAIEPDKDGKRQFVGYWNPGARDDR